MAEDFLFTSEGKILDSRLKLNKVRRKKEKIYLFSFLNIDFLANYMFLNENFVCSVVDYPIIWWNKRTDMGFDKNTVKETEKV